MKDPDDSGALDVLFLLTLCVLCAWSAWGLGKEAGATETKRSVVWHCAPGLSCVCETPPIQTAETPSGWSEPR